MSTTPSSFQITRQRLALWYTGATAILLLLFASGFYAYVRSTLIERIDDTLSHVVEVVGRSLVVTPADATSHAPARLNLEVSFRDNTVSVEDDHIDLEWFSSTGELLWSTFSAPLDVPLHPNVGGETVEARLRGEGEGASQDTEHTALQKKHSPISANPANPDLPSSHPPAFLPSRSPALPLRQVTQRIEVDGQLLGYLRVSHPWFEVTKPTRQLVRDLSVGTVLIVGAVAAIGWVLSGLAIAPVRDSYQRLKQFTADASHELRNPIAVIQTNVQVALADPNPDPQEQQEQLRVVERLTRRLGRLVDDLLFLARQDSGMIPHRTEQVGLEELLSEVVEEQAAIATDQGIALLFLPQSDIETYRVEGDRDQLTRLFTNLISNAIQYTSKDGKVTVTLQRSKHPSLHPIQIKISDTGIGIPSEALPYIFDRFYRADPARSHRNANNQPTSAGSGLGLAIAKVIIENHQGTLQVESIVGQGTVVMVGMKDEG